MNLPTSATVSFHYPCLWVMITVVFLKNHELLIKTELSTTRMNYTQKLWYLMQVYLHLSALIIQDTVTRMNYHNLSKINDTLINHEIWCMNINLSLHWDIWHCYFPTWITSMNPNVNVKESFYIRREPARSNSNQHISKTKGTDIVIINLNILIKLRSKNR